MSCFVSSPTPFAVDAVGVRTDLGQVLGYALLLWLLVRGLSTRPGSPAGGGPLVLLTGAMVVGALVGLAGGGDPSTVLGQLKEYLLYLLVVPLLALTSDGRGSDALERAVTSTCTAGSAYVCASAATGGVLPVVSPDVEVNTLGVLVEAQRIRPAMLPLLVGAVLLLSARVVARGWSTGRVAQAVLYALALLFSLNRSYWVPLLVLLPALLLACPGRTVPLRTLRTTAVLVLGGPLLTLALLSGALGPTTGAAVERLASVGSSQITRDPSYTDRQEEYGHAFEALAAHPVTGVGLARPYGARRPVYDGLKGLVVYEDRIFSHNGLLQALLHGGLLALAALGWLAVAAVRSALDSVRRGGPGDGRRLAGSFALLALFLISLLNTLLAYRPATVAVCAAFVLARGPVEEADV